MKDEKGGPAPSERTELLLARIRKQLETRLANDGVTKEATKTYLKLLEDLLQRNVEQYGIGPLMLYEATDGHFWWNDPGMDDLEAGWEDFPVGTRVEVRTEGDIWRKGTVVESWETNERCHIVECDEAWHENAGFPDGQDCSLPVFMNSRRGILSMIRHLG